MISRAAGEDLQAAGGRDTKIRSTPPNIAADDTKHTHHTHHTHHGAVRQHQKSDNTPGRYLVVSLSPPATPRNAAFLSIFSLFFPPLISQEIKHVQFCALGFSSVNKL